MDKIKIITAILLLTVFTSCKDFLDVVPDNVATIDNAFTMRSEAEKFLFTCYSYLPDVSDVSDNPAFLAGDEFWFYPPPLTDINDRGWQIARGNQNVVEPFMNYWDGREGGTQLFRGIRECNIFLDNIQKVLDLDPYERDRWIAEVKFLKAYYHFWLLKMYGPIPIIDENLPISSSVEEVKVERRPVEEVFDYIVNLINEAVPHLPLQIQNTAWELGRITKPIALGMKAKILVTAASPMFNGNTDYNGFTSKDDEPFFNPEPVAAIWDSAAAACKVAIDAAHQAGHKLFTFSNAFLDLSDTTILKMSIRNSVCDPDWNTELIWGSSNSRAIDIQLQAMLRIDPSRIVNQQMNMHLAPTMRIAEMFYSKNGVPIKEDKTWDYSKRHELRVGDEAHKHYISEGYETVALHFDREPRFYASMAFDGAIWYGQGRYDDEDTWHIESKMGQTSSRRGLGGYSITGYFTKKLVNWNFIIEEGQSYSLEAYPWPIMRLADLYLLYAEALNEATGPRQEVYDYVNMVRERAGLKTVEESWSQYSVNPAKYQNKDGLREIIQQERLIELSFEAHRFWDLRRWKKSVQVLNSEVVGWDVEQETAQGYYRPKVLYNQSFRTRDYLWPIREYDLSVNRNLIQNPGW